MGIFNNSANQGLTEREVLQQKIYTARINILLIVILTIVNSVILFADGESYFLFSAAFPYFTLAYCNAIVAVGGSVVFLVVAIGIMVTCLGLYMLCYFMSGKRSGWLIVALIMFALDTLFYLYVFVTVQLPLISEGAESVISSLLDIVIHGYALYYFVIAVINTAKLKKTAIEEVETNDTLTSGIQVQTDAEAEEAVYTNTTKTDND